MKPRDVAKGGFTGLLILFALLVGLWCWYCIAANYDYSALAGTYVFRSDGVTSTLLLRQDATFHQIVQQNGHIRLANGRWRRIGEGGVNFSPEFLRVSDAHPFIEQQPDHGDGTIADNEFYGEFRKFLGIYPSLYLDGEPHGPVFHRQLFR